MAGVFAAVEAVGAVGVCICVVLGDVLGVVICRCMPDELPPPRRLAASASATFRVSPRASTAANKENPFIEGSW